ncbi:MAG: nucleoside phosphorylase [Clostridia bacterium]|nr:nucleoside phosphorylase [Clostridia bacterium]
MSIIKHEIPILEFDTEKTAVLNPTHEKLHLKLPEKCVFAFLGDYIETYAKKTNACQVSHFVSNTKRFPIYITEYQGEEIVLCQAPVGAAPSAQILDWLIGYGVRKIISAGTCGALEAIPESTFLVPSKALRDEGTSYHYAPPSRYMETNEKATRAIEKTISEHGMKYREVITWSTDGFYRETKEKVAYRKSEGCAVVEMECAALSACAAFRGADFGMILYTADSLADVDRYDERNWGGDAYEYALTLCLDSVVKLL